MRYYEIRTENSTIDIVTNREEISERLRFLIKTTGAGLAPFDSWLILRGIKTLGIRMERAEKNAICIANWLKEQPTFWWNIRM